MSVKPLNNNPYHDFTVTFQGKARELTTEIEIGMPVSNQKELDQCNFYKTSAIWDTGATGSVITKKAAKALGLFPIGRTEVRGVNSKSTENVYLVTVRLPNKVVVSPVRVTECESLTQDDSVNLDVLIGMDIISHGDFAVTCPNGDTMMSFRFPSVSKIDFTETSYVRPIPGSPIPKFNSRAERRKYERDKGKLNNKK